MFWDGDEDLWPESDDDEEVAAQNPIVDSTASQIDHTNQHHDEEEETIEEVVQSESASTVTAPRIKRPPSYLELYDCGFTDADICVMLKINDDPQTFEDTHFVHQMVRKGLPYGKSICW